MSSLLCSLKLGPSLEAVFSAQKTFGCIIIHLILVCLFPYLSISWEWESGASPGCRHTPCRSGPHHDLSSLSEILKLSFQLPHRCPERCDRRVPPAQSHAGETSMPDTLCPPRCSFRFKGCDSSIEVAEFALMVMVSLTSQMRTI